MPPFWFGKGHLLAKIVKHFLSLQEKTPNGQEKTCGFLQWIRMVANIKKPLAVFVCHTPARLEKRSGNIPECAVNNSFAGYTERECFAERFVQCRLPPVGK